MLEYGRKYRETKKLANEAVGVSSSR
jgi:hypothetical protein